MEIISKFINKLKSRNNGTIGVGVNSSRNFEVIITSLIIVLVAFGSFGLGRLSKIGEGKLPLTVTQMEAQVGKISEITSSEKQALSGTAINPKEEVIPSTIPGGFIVASKSGKKYHFPWCGGAQQIKEENKVWFSNEDEARLAGYTPAANCKGLTQ